MKIESGIIDVSELVKMMNDAAALTSIHFAEDERMKLLTACANLRASLETPFEATIRFMFGVLEPSFPRQLLLNLSDSSSCCTEDCYRYEDL